MSDIDDEFNRRKTVDDYLNEVDFQLLNRNGGYIPTEFALKFMNFIKLVNGEKGEENKTPVMHLVMLDKLQTKDEKIANLCARGTAKTALFMEYFTMYLAVFGRLPNFGEVSGMLYISDSMDNGVKSARNSIEFRYNNSEFMQYWVPEARFTENYLEFKNRSGHQLGIKMFGAKSGIRGTKIFNKRPVIAVMDDLVSDADSKSQTAMQAIKDTVYSGVQYALHPSRRKMILNGTPFNKGDIVYEAIESGAWKVNVWPICEQFPCKPEDFRGAWEDRFTYEYVKTQYESAVKEGNLKSFQQELMLRITSNESRLVQDADIGWTSRADILNNKQDYNFYITSDFSTSSKQTADYAVLSVWAYSKQAEWIWVDGIVERQSMTQTVNDLFRLCAEYQPQGVGVEISGQQQGFVDWLMMEMNNREQYFNLTQKDGKPGIRPATDKLARFNMVVPLFKSKKVKFVEEMRLSRVLGIFLEQIAMVTKDGIKGKDDCVDTVSMLQYMNPWIPSGSVTATSGSQGKELPREVWGSMDADPGATDDSNYGSYMA